ncbi:TPA: hypothetical protein EYP38_03825, partial [Candidatus Micrarchaeota archaeon]|nr:hypothetical protein [Candidatus Micrarchaeota archaeon]
MTLRFNEDAVAWLEKHGFSMEDRAKLASVLEMIHRRLEKNEGPLVILPKDTPENVAAMAYLLDSITDMDGNMLCFGEGELLTIPDEARQRWREAIELEELDMLTDKLKKAKFARGQMD